MQYSKSFELANSFCLCLAVVLTLVPFQSLAGQELEDQLNTIENFVANQCLECHEGKDAQAGFNFEGLDFSSKQFENSGFDSTRWEKILRRLDCLLYTSPSPRDATLSRMPSSA